MKKVSIITVNYNQKRITELMLDSVFATNTYNNIEIFVVDNASNDNPVHEWRSKYPNVQFIRSEHNLGFAGGNNLAVKKATGDFLFLVNNDTEFTVGLIETLVKTLEDHPRVGMVCPKIRYYDKPEILQYVGFTAMNYYTARNKCLGQFERDNGQYDNTTGPTAYPHGAAMMVRKTAVEKAGMMTEIYYLYYEEMDWCEQIKKAGFEVWVNMQALIYHKESVSVGARSMLKEYFMNRNRILFIRRNAAFKYRIVFYVYFILIVAPRNILGYIKDKRLNGIKTLLKAIFWNITNGKNSAYLGY